MNNYFSHSYAVLVLLFVPFILLAQAPDLGVASGFSVFTGIGAFNNDGTTMVTGDIGTNIGPLAGFPPGTIDGTIHVQDAVSLQASIDVGLAYSSLSAVTCDVVLGVGLGNTQVLSPNVYCIGGATTLNGDLTLDGQGDPDALFIFQIDGALSTGVNSRVILINGASLCNVYWQINGAVDLGDFSVFLGTFIANGQITALESATIYGRALATVGAVSLHNNVIMVGLPPTPSVIAADGPITFCAGSSVVLSGNTEGVWSTGETTPTITVTTSGDYFVTNSTICGSEASNLITVTVNPLPTVTITPGTIAFCEGDEALLTANASSNVSYSWSTGETTQSIIVTTEGNYSVTVTDANGCVASASAAATVNTLPVAAITPGGPVTFCEGGDVLLCVNSGIAYLWSTGATGQCITVSATGTYAVTLTDVNGCSANAVIGVTADPAPVCAISGTATFCAGGSTELCAAAGFATYEWSTGAASQCITVTVEGNYAVTVTDANGCAGVCNQAVTEAPAPVCAISGAATFCAGGSTELCAADGFATYEWSTGAASQCITLTVEGNYAVTVTDANGCAGVCNQVVTEDPAPVCAISGTATFCAGGSTELCAAAGFATYEWSTGAARQCITVSDAGNYAVTVTDANGCTGVCNQVVTEDPAPVCAISGAADFCAGGSTELCAAAGFATYEWSTGAASQCITVTDEGNYAVTVTDANGCSNTCDHVITLEDNTPPEITCPPTVVIECGESTLPLNTGIATATDNCTVSPVIGSSDLSVGGVCPRVNTITRTWMATDENGNTLSCVQIISIEDNTAPTITCPAEITVACAEDVPPFNIQQIIAMDVCDQNLVITHLGDEVTDQICENNYLLIRTYRATDDCNNFEECTQLIRVTDFTPPTIIFNSPLYTSGDTITVSCFGQDPDWNLPDYDEGSVTVTDYCGSTTSVTFNHVLENEGNCAEDGYISLFRLTWTATDFCNNSSDFVLSLSLVDTIPPVIFGVPDDITVNCDEIPAISEFIYATDECLCACIIYFEESVLAPGCLNGQVLVRTWTATDRCGNTTTQTQNITFVDSEGPQWEIILPGLSGIEDGAIVEYTCEEGGIPAIFNLLNEEAIYDASTCGTAFGLTFESTSIVSSNCEADGFVEQNTYRWSGYDACDNQSEFVLITRLVDHEAPTFVGIKSRICSSDPALNEVRAIDDCTQPTMRFWDVTIPGSCGGKNVLRTYEAVDDCGNTSRATTIIVPGSESSPVITFNNPALVALGTGDTLRLEIVADSGVYTSFGITDVTVENSCTGNVSVIFRETTVAMGDCSITGVVALVELEWIATDICGNRSILSIMVNMVDESSPVFPFFVAEIAIGCGDTITMPAVTDNSGKVTMNAVDNIIQGNCAFEYTIQRVITATDPCGNSTTRQQIIRVGTNEGPAIEGVDEIICEDLSIPDVTAYDDCAGEFVPVTMQQDTIESLCEGLVLRRTWRAVNSCGVASESSQFITLNDQLPPTISLPRYSVIRSYSGPNRNVAYLGWTNVIDELNALNANSVIVSDDCSQLIIPLFSILINYPEDCEKAGYSEERVHTWIATDACGNSTTYSFTVRIVDDVPPVFYDVPGDITITCAPLPSVPEVSVDDTTNFGAVEYTQTIVPGNEPEVFIVTREWVASDACGNTSVAVQTITWIPDTFLDCALILPEDVECNSHGIIISTAFTEGLTYDWEIVGEKCFIQSGQNTPEITIYMGWSTVKIILTVTDSFGCTSMCMAFLDCGSIYSRNLAEPAIEKNPLQNTETGIDKTINSSTVSSYNLKLSPNPARERVFLSFDSYEVEEVEIRLMTTLGQVILADKITAHPGSNAYEINLMKVLKGSYLVQVKTKQGRLTKVVVVL